MRSILIGTGAVGGTIGGQLAAHGRPVVWVARGEHGAVLRDRGLTLHTPGGTVRASAPVWSGPAEASLEPGDVLVLATKTNAAEAAAREWADVPVAGGGTAGERLPILVCTNGLAAESLVLRYFARVYGVCVWCPATFLSPGEIIVRFGPQSASLHVGRVPAALADAADARLLADLEAEWESANLEITLPEAVLPWKARKLVTNMANAVDALLGPSGDAARRRDLVRGLEAEAYRVLSAAGVPVTPDEDEAATRASGPSIQPVAQFDPATMGVSSTWQSLVKGGDLETDFLNGEIVLLAHQAGVAAPRNAALCRLARAAVRTGARPGDLTVAELDAALNG